MAFSILITVWNIFLSVVLLIGMTLAFGWALRRSVILAWVGYIGFVYVCWQVALWDWMSANFALHNDLDRSVLVAPITTSQYGLTPAQATNDPKTWGRQRAFTIPSGQTVEVFVSSDAPGLTWLVLDADESGLRSAKLPASKMEFQTFALSQLLADSQAAPPDQRRLVLTDTGPETPPAAWIFRASLVLFLIMTVNRLRRPTPSDDPME